MGLISQGAGSMGLKKQGSREHGSRKTIEFGELVPLRPGSLLCTYSYICSLDT